MMSITDQPRVIPAVAPLRTGMYKTLRRKCTLGINFVFTNNVPDERIDAAYLDYRDASKGNLGIGYHYVIKINGDIEVARDPLTISAGGFKRHRKTHILVGVVGGRDEDTGKVAKTLTEAQSASMSYLEQALANALNLELEIEDDQIRQHGEQKLDKSHTELTSILDDIHRHMTPEELGHT